MDEHVGEEAPGLLPALGLVCERAVPDAILQSDPLLLGLPHGVVNKHCQLVGDRRRHSLKGNAQIKASNHLLFLFFLFLCRKYHSKVAFGCAAAKKKEKKLQTAEKIKMSRMNVKNRCVGVCLAEAGKSPVNASLRGNVKK